MRSQNNIFQLGVHSLTNFFRKKLNVGNIFYLILKLYINYILNRFNRKEFKTTEIEENAMAAAAKIGLSKIPKNG